MKIGKERRVTVGRSLHDHMKVVGKVRVLVTIPPSEKGGRRTTNEESFLTFLTIL